MKHLRKFNESKYEICQRCDLDEYPIMKSTGTCLKCRDEEIGNAEHAKLGDDDLSVDAAKWYRDIHRTIKELGEPDPQGDDYYESYSLKLFEEFDKDGYESHWKKFVDWLTGEKDFDLYAGEEDLKKNFLKIVNNDSYSADEKAQKVAAYLDMKWGLYDGYSEVVDYLESLLMDEI
jgi:hypothetical protein